MKYQLTLVQLEKLNQMLDIYLKTNGMAGYQVTIGTLDAFRDAVSRDESDVVYELNDHSLQLLHQIFDSTLKSLGLKGFESVMEMVAVFSNPIPEVQEQVEQIEIPSLENFEDFEE